MKKIFVLSFALFMSLLVTSPAFADSNIENTIAESPGTPRHSVEVTNSDSGEKEFLAVDESDVTFRLEKLDPIKSQSLGVDTFLIDSLNEDVSVYAGSVEIDLTQALEQSGSTTQNGLITVTAGLVYSVNASQNTVKINKAFGSTVGKANYYATNREFYWRNPNGYGGTYTPGSDSWNYAVSDIWAAWQRQSGPYAILDAEIKVAGMEGTGTESISVSYYAAVG